MANRYGANGQVYIGPTISKTNDVSPDVVEISQTVEPVQKVHTEDLIPKKKRKIKWENVDGKQSST